MSDDSRQQHLTVHHGLEDEHRAGALEKQIDFLAGEVTRLMAAMPTPEEMAFLRDRKLEAERAQWLWRTVKTHAPLVASILTAVGVSVVWLLTHNIDIRPKP
jgi:hypothetical protein